VSEGGKEQKQLLQPAKTSVASNVEASTGKMEGVGVQHHGMRSPKSERM
jgi:hypothetical protein